LKNIVVFASGSGTNFKSIIDAVKKGTLQANIKGFVTNNPECGAILKAQKNNIETYIIEGDKIDQKLISKLEEWKTDLIILAGFLKKIPSNLVHKYKGKIINIHPSLLPKYGGKGFYGMHVHRAVINNNDTESGCTVHLVTEKYDDGPILAQEKVKIHKNDTPESLAKKVLHKEHQLLPKVISSILKNEKI